MFNGDAPKEDGVKNASPRSKNQMLSSSAYHNPAQLREQREQRKEKFLTEFNTSPRYVMLRDKLKKSVIRLAVEKHQKTVGSQPQTAQQRDKFKADLYCFLVEQMRVALDLVFKHNVTQLNPDLVQVREQVQEEKRRVAERCFRDETRRKRAERLFREFDTVRDHAEAEKQMVVLCNSHMDSEANAEHAKQWKA